MKKYEIVRDDCIVYNGRTLYRIRALKDFWTAPKEMIHKGDLGGYVESENNLSQEGYCWIRNNAKVYDNAKVLDDADEDYPTLMPDEVITLRLMLRYIQREDL